MEDFQAMLRVRLTLDESSEKCEYLVITGSVYSNIPGESAQKLFNIIGVNKGRLFHKSDKYMINSKEVLFFEDHVTGRILNKWVNPFTGEENEVTHTYNDPVNVPLFPAFTRPPTKLWDGELAAFQLTVPLRYPNPLNPSDYPDYSTGEWYIASETFVTSSWLQDLYDTDRPSVPGNISWTRTCPWLPWMKMRERPGGLFYVANSWKCSEVCEIPSGIRARIQSIFPEFCQDPKPSTVPNQTTWITFKAMIDKRKEQGVADRVLPITKNGSASPPPLHRYLPSDKGSFELLNRETFTVNVSGNVSVIGSSERRSPFGIRGVATVSMHREDEKVKVSVKYDVRVHDVRTGEPLQTLPVPDTAQKVDVSPFTDSLELERSPCEINYLDSNKQKHFSFVGKNQSLLSINHVAMSFPVRNSASNQCRPVVFITAALPIPRWMEFTAPGEYCILNLCG